MIRNVLSCHVYCIFYGFVRYASAINETASYEAAQLWHTPLQKVADIILIKNLMDNQEIDLWHLSPQKADFVVHLENVEKVQQELSSRNLNYTVVMTNIKGTVESQMHEPPLWNENTLRLGHRLNWSTYPPLHLIEEYYNFLSEEYTSLCKVQTIGHTAENRTIKMINITNGNPNNKRIVILGGVHGREWTSITSVLYILNTIVVEFDMQPEFMQSINWIIIPLLNPDGYKFTYTHNRLWRKNRRKHISCNGVDINRNFEIDWGVAGITENNECKDAYAGPYSFSEAESVTVRKLLSKMMKKASALIDIHAYGQSILYPWSARTEKTQDIDVHIFTAQGMVQAIRESSGRKYSHGTTYHKVYPATGSLLDWAYSQGVKHSYVIETRDNGKYGFLLPANEIEDTAKDLYVALKFLAKCIDLPITQREIYSSSRF